MSTKIYEIIPYEVEALKWEKDNWEEVVEFFKAHNTEIKNIVKYSEKALESFKKLNKTWLEKNIDNEGRHAFVAYRPEDDSHDEYEEFVELGDYFVIGKDGLIYVKHGFNFENMFREKENV